MQPVIPAKAMDAPMSFMKLRRFTSSGPAGVGNSFETYFWKAGVSGTALCESLVATRSNSRQTGPDLRRMLPYKM